MKKRTLVRVLRGLAATLAVLLLGLFLFVSFSWDKTYDAPYPEISATADSAAIARGKYLAYGPAHCATCHVPMEKMQAVEDGEEIPLSGGWELPIPPGTFRAPNLTPDLETGIGRLTDQEIARVMRHSIDADGRALFPFMPFQNMSDEDVSAIISFLRSQESVKNAVPPTEYSFMGKVIMSFGLIGPEGPNGTPPKTMAKAATVEYGAYLANSVGNCVGCHSPRDLKTGAFTGPRLSGGLVMPPDPFTKGHGFITPNLTPDAETGILNNWTEDQFVQRFRGGRVIEYSPMPWGSFSRMEEVELKAIYRYLHSLEPVQNKVEKIMFAPGEELPG